MILNNPISTTSISLLSVNIFHHFIAKVRVSTAKALSFLPPMGADKRIADIGCGTGASTEVLHRLTEAQIVAVDLFPDFINHLKNKNLGSRIDAQTGDMTQLTFADETFDAIWSEGAIYNIGFGKGLSEWRRFLKP